jgi:hypothetical protein
MVRHSQQITTADTALDDDMRSRIIKYSITMGIRTVCFVAAYFAFRADLHVIMWICVAGAVVLPYPAVIFANAGREVSRDDQSALLDEAPAAQLPPARGETVSWDTISGEAVDDETADRSATGAGEEDSGPDRAGPEEACPGPDGTGPDPDREDDEGPPDAGPSSARPSSARPSSARPSSARPSPKEISQMTPKRMRRQNGSGRTTDE